MEVWKIIARKKRQLVSFYPKRFARISPGGRGHYRPGSFFQATSSLM